MKTRRFFRLGLAVLLLCGMLAGTAAPASATVGRDNVLHPLQAEVFYKELQYLINEHGGVYAGSTATALPYGLLTADVVDFDADGIDELLMVYRSKQTGECYFKLMAYIDNVAKTLMEEKFNSDNMRLYTSGNKIYFVTNGVQSGAGAGQTLLTESYNTVVDGLYAAETVLGTEGAYGGGSSGYYINGAKVPQIEFSQKRSSYTLAVQVFLNGHQAGLNSAEIEDHRFMLSGAVEQVKQAITPLAVPTAAPVYVNFDLIQFDAYNINGSNYFKIRDIAYMINGTAKQFAVDFDKVVNAVTIATGKPYESIKTEMEKGPGLTVSAPLSKQTVLLNGEARRFEAYNINGSNYFKLRDLGEALNFGVDWNPNTGAIEINTNKDYTP